MTRSYKTADLSKDHVTQTPGDSLRHVFIGLSEPVRRKSVDDLNQILVDSIMIRDMYKKHHWQLSGPTFYQLHLLLDSHYEQQNGLIDTVAERIQILGGVAIGMPKEVAEMTRIEHPPVGRECPAAQITRLLNAHQVLLKELHSAAHRAGEDGDDRTEDLLVSDFIAINEKQSWFISEHLIDTERLGDVET